eukprot:1457891-Amphidinium_carterae.1
MMTGVSASPGVAVFGGTEAAGKLPNLLEGLLLTTLCMNALSLTCVRAFNSIQSQHSERMSSDSLGDEGGRSLLHWAALGGGLQFVRVGLTQEHCTTLCGVLRKTLRLIALCASSFLGQVVIQDILVDARADSSQTPLMWAAASGLLS